MILHELILILGMATLPAAAAFAQDCVPYPNPMYPVGSYPIHVAAADLDDDGILDLVVAN